MSIDRSRQPREPSPQPSPGVPGEGVKSFTAACDPSPLALLIGEERQGLSARALAMSDLKIRLPMTDRADSLNLGVAASVMMYELLRRRCVDG